MIIWVNGTFGVGKTTVSQTYVSKFAGSRIFDPEHVGYMLAGNLKDVEFDDFQDLAPWRALVPQTLREVQHLTGATIVAPQSVLDESYWAELRTGMEAAGLDVIHTVLHCDTDVLVSRIENDKLETGARQWRLDHVDRYSRAQTWMHRQADLWIDTTNCAPDEICESINASAGDA